MTRDEKIAAARRMRAAGATLREVGKRFGVSRTTVLRWTDDDYAERSRAACRALKERYRGACVDCGAATNGSDGPGTAAERCAPCTLLHSRKLTRRWILDSIGEWVALFGVPPSVQDWNPHMARANGREDLVRRAEGTGRPWPDVSTVQDHFGSWNAALAEAGYEPCPQGQRRDPEAWRHSVRVHHRTAMRDARVAELFAQGLTYAEIAAAEGVARTTMIKRVRRMRAEGWDLPRRSGGRRREARQ